MTICAPIRGAIVNKMVFLTREFVGPLLFTITIQEKQVLPERYFAASSGIINTPKKAKVFGKRLAKSLAIFTVIATIGTLAVFLISGTSVLHSYEGQSTTKHSLNPLKAPRFSTLMSYGELLAISDDRMDCFVNQGYPNIVAARCYKVYPSQNLPYIMKEFQFCDERSMTNFYPRNLAEVAVMDEVLKHYSGKKVAPEIELGYSLVTIDIEHDRFVYQSVDGSVALDNKSKMWANAVSGQDRACQFLGKFYDCGWSYADRKSLFVCFAPMPNFGSFKQ